jgi:hypothetical protein
MRRIETTNEVASLKMLLEFEYDAFISLLPKELWNHIFSLLETKELNSPATTSKSCCCYLCVNIPPA